MLSRFNRLPGREVEGLFKGRAQTAHATSFSIRAQLSVGVEPPKATIVAGVKTFKSAVSRARVKRRLRHALRGLMPLVKPGSRLVVMAKEPALKMDFEELVKELRASLIKLSVLKR